MKTLRNLTRRFITEDEGAALLEYGILVLLIAVLCITAVKAIGSKINTGFTTINTNLP
jgi:pilus assembly protein Flp/PilA